MYFYVRFEDSVRVISNVTIDEDCGPIVEGKLISESPRSGGGDENASSSISVSSPSTVDAISWFKSMPMEAVYLDCSARDARWLIKPVTIQQSKSDPNEHLLTPKVSVRLRRNPNKRVYIDAAALRVEENRPFMPETARALFSDHPGVVDFNPIIDEMFERAEGLVRHWDQLLATGELYREVAQILHCYVFPAVTFQREDIAALQECLRLVVVKQEAVEGDIKETERNIDVTEKYLNRQKEVILAIEAVTTQAYLQACDKQFVESMYVHVTKDIKKKNARLDNTQLKMNDLRKSAQEEGTAGKLQKLKDERDGIYEIVQKLIVVREAIRNHLYRPFIPKKKKKRIRTLKLTPQDVNLHSVFVQVHQQLTEQKDRLRKFCYRKLYTSAVREAVESTIKMITVENQRGLGDFSEFSVYLGNSEIKKKQWQSMQAKVEEWMSTDNSLFRSHVEGCQLVKDLSCGILSDGHVASLGLETESSEEGGGGGGGGAADICDLEMSIMSSMGDVSGALAPPPGRGEERQMTAEDSDPSYRRAPMVKVMRDQAKLHTWDMAERIVNRMEFHISPGTRHINRAWVCYEPYFWRQAGAAVEQVYAHYHAPQARKVHRLVCSVALSDIMDSNFFHDFFHQRLSRTSSGVGGGGGRGGESSEKSAVSFPKAADSVSAVSLDLMRCSVSDLYARVNRDGARLNYEMLEIEAMCGSLDLFSVQSDSSGDLTAAQVGDDSDATAPLATKLGGEDAKTDLSDKSELGRSDSSTSDSGASVHSDDLFDPEVASGPKERGSSSNERTERVRSSSQTVASVLSLFELVVEPYHELVKEVLDAPSVMEKMRAVWKSVDFLCQKSGEICQARGMDTLLPLSIFTTTSFPEDLFVRYYVQLLILTDLKPSFAFHSMYDFSLTSALSSYMYLFEANCPTSSAVASSDESDRSST
ncbi:hypothetical protein ACOMHN_012615 [Nucella lapillus]